MLAPGNSEYKYKYARLQTVERKRKHKFFSLRMAIFRILIDTEFNNFK